MRMYQDTNLFRSNLNVSPEMMCECAIIYGTHTPQGTSLLKTCFSPTLATDWTDQINRKLRAVF